MIDKTPAPLTLKDAVSYVERHGTPSQHQDIRKAKKALAIHGVEGPEFDIFPADLAAYEKAVPKLRGSMPPLQALIEAAGISDGSYKQIQRAGRRLIETVTGAKADKIERKGREDDWAELLRLIAPLVKAGFVRPQNRIALTALIDTSRAAGIAPQDLTRDQVHIWLSNAHTAQCKKLRNGLKALDTLRNIDRLLHLLPRTSVTPASKPASRIHTLPTVMQHAINEWVDVAAREQMEDVRYDHLATQLSAPTRATYSAAASLYVQTLFEQNPFVSTSAELDHLFSEKNIDMVLAAWGRSENHTERTLTEYTKSIGALLHRNGLPEVAAYITGLTKVLPHLIKGRSAAKTMSPKVKKWCETLLRDPKKTVLFQVQHFEYYHRALQNLTAAKNRGFDLQHLSKPEVMAALPDKERSAAKKMLRKVKMYGLMAAYSAIALEGAPFRRQNMLSLRHYGPKKTMHLQLSRGMPQVVIKFPNEELKNGKYLSERGEELEPITITKRGTADLAIDIIKFYLREIRPLFPEADKTHAFFPPLKAATSLNDGFVKGTFYLWLSEASSEIGLPMNSHNYRHGFCSIDINEGHRSMEDLAKILGDTVAVVQRSYAWINAKQSVLKVQQDTARRRQEILKARGRAA